MLADGSQLSVQHSLCVFTDLLNERPIFCIHLFATAGVFSDAELVTMQQNLDCNILSAQLTSLICIM
ncbi:hypothetical protein KM043_004615 [Ampulex compressa]|nr:hypothetical protein KM043_004615 [Ampulex compressa]